MQKTCLNKKNIIFDLDGVIAETDTGRFELLAHILSAYNIALQQKFTTNDLKGISTIKFLKDNFTNLSLATINKIISDRHKLFFSNLDKYCSIIPGAIDTIHDLHLANYSLSIATSNDAQMTQTLLKYMGIEKHFYLVLTREQTENHISGKKDYRRVVEMLKKDPSECVVIEDSALGINSAKRAGFFCIAFNYNFGNYQIKNADLIIRDYNQLRQFFGLTSLLNISLNSKQIKS